MAEPTENFSDEFFILNFMNNSSERQMTVNKHVQTQLTAPSLGPGVAQ